MLDTPLGDGGASRAVCMAPHGPTQDPATGALTLDAALPTLAALIGLAQRAPLHSCVAVLSLDQPRAAGGAPRGSVPRALVHLLSRLIRPSDILAGLDGAALVLLIPDADLAAAVAAAERIRRAIAQHDWDGAEGVVLTASIGVAEIRASDTVDSVLARADAARRDAVAAGHDRVRAAN